MNDEAIRGPRTQIAVWLAEAGWSDVLVRVVRGFCHDLNGRATSLDAVQQLMEMGDPPTDLRDERDRLSKITQALSLIAGDPDGPPGPLMLQEVVTSALELASRARRDVSAAAEVEVADGLMPVRVNETRVMHAVVVLIDALASANDRFPNLRVEGDEAEVRLLLGRSGSSSCLTHVPAEVVAALGRLLGMDGGVVSETETGFQITFPSLAALRKGER